MYPVFCGQTANKERYSDQYFFLKTYFQRYSKGFKYIQRSLKRGFPYTLNFSFEQGVNKKGSTILEKFPNNPVCLFVANNLFVENAAREFKIKIY